MRSFLPLVASLLCCSGVARGQLAQDGWPAVAPEIDPSGTFPFVPALHNACAYDIDGDGVVEVIGTNSAGPWMWSFEPDGTITPGWDYQVWNGTPALAGGAQHLLYFGDITGDGISEIVFTNRIESAAVYALDAQGVMLPGWPLWVGTGNDEIGRMVLADLTGDGTLEVIVQDRWLEYQSRIWVYDAAGNVLPGWPRTVEGYAVGLAVGDLEFDGTLEIISSSAHPWSPDEGPYPIYVFDGNGNVRNGWPVWIPAQPLAPGVLLDIGIADLDGDYRCEIFGPGAGVFYILDWQGNQAHPPIYGTGIGLPAAVGDLEGDGLLELVIPSNGMTIFRLSDSSLVSIPAFSTHTGYDGVVIADVDGDGACEIGARSSSPPALHLWNSSLQSVPGWPRPSHPIDTIGRRVVTLADIDADGDIEMVCAARIHIECWDIPNPSGNALRIEWGTYNHDGQRTGNYHHGRPPPGPRFLRGDADGDGAIRFGDAFVALSVLFVGAEHECLARADWNADGVLDLCDVVNQLTYSFLAGPPPVPPFPHCSLTEEGPLPCEREACP